MHSRRIIQTASYIENDRTPKRESDLRMSAIKPNKSLMGAIDILLNSAKLFSNQLLRVMYFQALPLYIDEPGKI